ncbi:uncharacterized protein LOC143982219 [Lithobates pipiens]
MDAKYSLEIPHFFLSINVFLVMFNLSEALCPGLGHLQNGTTFFRYGGLYTTFTCNHGLRLLGHVSNSCIRGKWMKPLPVCVANGCHLPTGISHGSLQTTHNNAVITFICNKGYKLFGSSLIYCNGKRWNGTMPVCRDSDMMSSSHRKTIAQMSSSVIMRHLSLSGKSSEDLHRIFYNTTQNEPDNYHSDISFRSDSTTIIRIKTIQNKKSSYQHKELPTFWENQSSLHLTPGDKLKSTNKSSAGERYSSIFSSILESRTESPKINVTNWYNLSNVVQTERQTTKWTENKTSNMETIPFPTTLKNDTLRSLIPKEHYPNTENYASPRNVFTSLFTGPLSHLRTTPSKVEGTTQWIQPGEVFTNINHTLQSHSVSIQSSNLHLLSSLAGTVTPEATTNKSSMLRSTYGSPKHVTTSANLKHITNHSEYANIEEKPTANIPSITLTSITAIKYTQMLPVSFHQQLTQGSISQTNSTTQGKQYKYNEAVYEVTAKLPTLRYKTTAIQSLLLAKKPSKTIHGTEEITVVTPRVTFSTRIPHTTKANRNQLHHGALKNALKRRVRCFYPPVPFNGTFRFLTLKDPLPNQYQYYIQYYCYPGYTMTQGDVYSFCMENGTWSGATPICEDL